MKCTKEIILTGYNVQFINLQETKPRTVQSELYTVDKDWAEAAAMMHLDVKEVIKARYERFGYKVISVERFNPKRVVALDLNQLWAQMEESRTDIVETLEE